ncbi:MAG: hypothetical protein ACKOXB_07475 [Flavobacteriales bacterium]
MERSIFKRFEKRHCRIKMKSGKEVYGVMWEENVTENKFRYYFSSSSDYQRLKSRLQSALFAIYQVDLNDIVYAEVISK